MNRPMTTVAICGNGKVYDMGQGEYPPSTPFKDGTIREKKYMVVNAFTIPIDDVSLLKKRKGMRV